MNQKYTHIQPGELDVIFGAIDRELQTAINKFPTFPTDIIHMVAIMAEESGESVQAALQCIYEDKPVHELENELIQTAAMCVRCLIHLREK